MNITAGWPVPDFTLRPFAKVMAWHYTPRWNLEGIIEAGAILPSCMRGEDRWQRPVILFTTANSLREQRPEGGLALVPAGRHKTTEWLRFGYDGADLFPIAQAPFVLRRNPAFATMEEGFIRHHKSLGFAVGWHAVFRPIAVDEFSIIQASDDNGETWRDVWINPKEATGSSSPHH